MTTYNRMDDPTRIAVASMLVENTGVHMLDSGGYSGRAWQRNQAKVGEMSPVEYFEGQPEGWWGWPSVYPHPAHRAGKRIEDQRAELWPTISVYHWLVEHVTLNEEMDKAYAEFVTSDDEGRERWRQPATHLALMEEFPEHWARLQAKHAAEEERETRRRRWLRRVRDRRG